MTLANFNSNFNWQLRALQQAAGCCGIVPNLPPPTPCYCYEITSITGTCTIEYIDCDGNPQTTITDKTYPVHVCAQENTVNLICLAPLNAATVSGGTVICTNTVECQPLCYYYIALGDVANSGFNPIFQEPVAVITSGTFNSYTFPNWSNMMTSYYPTSGGFAFTTDPFSYTSPNSLAFFWTLTQGTPEEFNYTDSFSNDNGLIPWSTKVCAPACFRGEIDTNGSAFTQSIQVVGAFAFVQGWVVDLTDVVGTSAYLTALLQQYFGPAASASIQDLGGGIYQLDILNIYTDLSDLYVTMQDTSFWILFKTPC